MLITKLIEKLERIKERDGDIEVMTTQFDGVEAYQTTVENLFIEDYDFQVGGKEKVVRLTL